MPKARLETFIIVPFEIGRADRQDWKVGDLQATLCSAGWKRLAGHEPDRISAHGLDEEALKDIRYQAYNYFHPFVRRFWFDQGLVQRFRRSDVEALECTIGDRTIVLDAVCDLLYFTPDIAVLVLHLRSRDVLEFQAVQNCLDRLRRIYPPYLDKRHDKYPGGHFPNSVELWHGPKKRDAVPGFDSSQLNGLRSEAAELEETAGDVSSHTHLWAEHWQQLLKPINGAGSVFFARQLGDDRAALASMITLENQSDDPPLHMLIDRGNLIRLCFADEAGSDILSYSKSYLRNFEERFCYDRFWYVDDESTELSSRIMNCGYAFTWLGDSRDKIFFGNHLNGAPVSYRHIYVPMAIIAHFQKAALLVTTRRLADLSPYKDRKPSTLDAKKFQALKAGFIAFTQTYWFEEVTPQEQGIELFEMWRTRLRLQSSYDEMRQELQDIVQFVDSRENQNQTSEAHRLNILVVIVAIFGLAIAVAGLASSILGMNTFDMVKPPIQVEFVACINWVAGNVGRLSLALFGIIAVMVIVACFRYRRRGSDE